MATTATPSPVLPHQTGNNLNNGNVKSNRPPGGSRMLRTLSRFLSGGNKQTKQTRPAKLDTSNNQQANQEGEGGGLGLAGADQHHQEEEEDGQDRSRSTSVSTAGQASSLVAQFPNDSRSRLSRQTSTSSTSSSARTSPTPSVNDNDNDDADTDASVYRLPPSTRGPSSITSRQTTRTHDSTSSFAPTHASTYRSNASTKPTTLLSVDSGGGGGNRIAVVPGTGQSPGGGMTSSNSANSLSPASSPSTQPNHTFSSLSPSFVPTHTGHRPSTSSTSSSISIPPPPLSLNPTGIPSHTLAHPRNNPHPSQFPNDNASLLTLASSSFAPSLSENRPPTERARNSWGGGGLTSLKAWSQKRGQVGGSGKRTLGIEADEDASVRVLPGSRRNSEESLGGRSTWSAGLGGGGGGGRSVVSVKVGDHDFDERERERERRRSSMKTVETGGKLDTGEEKEEEEAIETETEEGEKGDQEVFARRKEGEETEAEGVKKRAEERNDPVSVTGGGSMRDVDDEMEKQENGNAKGKGVDLEEHEGLKLAPPVPMSTD